MKTPHAPRPWSIRTWLFWIIGAIALPTAAFQVYSLRAESRLHRDLLQRNLVHIAQAVAYGLDQRLENTWTTLSHLARRPAMKEEHPARCDDLFGQFRELYPHYANLNLTDRSGRILCSAVPLEGRVLSVGGETFFQRMLAQDQPVLSEPIVGHVIGEWVNVFAYPRHDEHHHLVGGLSLSVNLARLQRWLDSVSLPAGGRITVLTASGTVVTRTSETTSWIGKNLRDTPLYLHVQAAPEGVFEAVGLDGVPRYYGYATLASSGWRVIVGVPVQSVQQPLDARLEQALFFGIPTLAFACLVSLGLSRRIARPARVLAAMARASIERLDDARLPEQGPRELAEMSRAFNALLETRKRAETASREQSERLQTLSRRLLEIQEEERRLLAHELHDEIGQVLTAVKLNLQTADTLSPSEDIAACLRDGIAVVERAIEQVRSRSLELRPSLLDDLGLVPALGWLIDQQAERSGLAIEFTAHLRLERLPTELETAFFRVAQEALTNVLRHAHARRVWVSLQSLGARIELRVRDDGVGFAVAGTRSRRATQHIGLSGMEERMHWVGGSLTLTSAPGRGTEIRAAAPLPTAMPLKSAASSPGRRSG